MLLFYDYVLILFFSVSMVNSFHNTSMLVQITSLLTTYIHSVLVSVNTLVISKYGASGDYPPCTDLAYEKAISDGVDVLDCPVQMSKDGIPFCLSSIDLIESTNVAQSSFSRLGKTIPEIKSGNGIFTFDLAWDNIKSLSRKSYGPILFIQFIYMKDYLFERKLE